jgi:hypothetical protein
MDGTLHGVLDRSVDNLCHAVCLPLTKSRRNSYSVRDYGKWALS